MQIPMGKILLDKGNRSAKVLSWKASRNLSAISTTQSDPNLLPHPFFHSWPKPIIAVMAHLCKYCLFSPSPLGLRLS